MQVDIPIVWLPRVEPLPPAAVAAVGAVAHALARRMLDESDEALAALRGVAGPGLLVVVGDAEALPWVDGVVYLGVDSRAKDMLMPTTAAPAIPVELVGRALAARFPHATPSAVLPDSGLVVPLAGARPIVRAALERWLEGGA
jgi:hypothetical protein